MTILPARLESDRLLIRLWAASDAPALSRALIDSYEHLRPWMGWVDLDEAANLDGYRARIDRWSGEWETGGDSYFGIFAGGILVGACGLHRRGTPDSLEIGYWIHASHTRLGYATEAARALTREALDLPGIERVEIHHDKANVTSGRIPPRLRYEFMGESPRDPVAPAEIGVECRWALTQFG